MCRSEDAPLLLRCARGEDVERPPVWLMRQAGRYMAEFRKFSDRIPFRQRSEDPDIAVELSLQPWKAFQTDGVIMFSDILTPLPALGIEFDILPGKGPAFPEPLRDQERIRRVLDARTEFHPEEKLGFVRKILQRLRTEISPATALLGFVGCPWTLAAYCVEGSSSKDLIYTKKLLHNRPELLRGTTMTDVDPHETGHARVDADMGENLRTARKSDRDGLAVCYISDRFWRTDCPAIRFMGTSPRTSGLCQFFPAFL